jgi:hypothetical protein
MKFDNSKTVNARQLVNLQFVNIEALNNIGVIGAGFAPRNLNVNPKRWASTYATL